MQAGMELPGSDQRKALPALNERQLPSPVDPFADLKNFAAQASILLLVIYRVFQSYRLCNPVLILYFKEKCNFSPVRISGVRIVNALNAVCWLLSP